MAQVLKDEVRERILAAALEVFAAQGFIGATMAMIAERAGVGTAGMYRYYKSKDALFRAVITPELARRFESLLDVRVRALARNALRDERSDAYGDEMLRFWIDHRHAVVVLLDRAAGTPYAEYGQRFVDHLVQSTLSHIREEHPGLRIAAPARFVLQRIFESTRGTLAAILAEHDDERQIRQAIEAFWSYQIAGLLSFTEHVRA